MRGSRTAARARGRRPPWKPVLSCWMCAAPGYRQWAANAHKAIGNARIESLMAGIARRPSWHRQERCVQLHCIPQVRDPEILVGGMLIVVVIRNRHDDRRLRQHIREKIERQ